MYACAHECVHACCFLVAAAIHSCFLAHNMYLLLSYKVDWHICLIVGYAVCMLVTPPLSRFNVCCPCFRSVHSVYACACVRACACARALCSVLKDERPVDHPGIPLPTAIGELLVVCFLLCCLSQHGLENLAFS